MTQKASTCGPLVVIVGPTASGKSALAMQIAREHDGEIVAADSRTVYRGMDIGTSKPSLADQREIPHHLIDIRNPDESFSAAEFQALALKAIRDIGTRGKLPILVGGTGLYIDAVIFDYEFGSAADPRERRRLSTLTVQELQQICRYKNIDLPINSSNARHLVRAIELGGLIRHDKYLRPHTIVVGLSTKRAVLRDRIKSRIHSMIDQGVAKEAKKLSDEYGWEGEALKGNIYRVLRGFLEGAKSETEVIDECVRSDMTLAKRQMTWFRRNPHIVWSDEPGVLRDRVESFCRVKQ